jgi:uncharacterized protein (TIRG00374 family)
VRGKLALGIALGAIFLYLSLRQVDLQETWKILQGARYHYFIAFLSLNIAVLWLRAVRWGYLLRPVRRVHSTRLLSPLCIGLMANFIFPARAGEFIRAYLVGRRENVSKSSAFATVVVERLFDGLAIISFLGLAPIFFSRMDGNIVARLQWAGLAVFLFYVAVFAVLLVLSHHRKAFSAFLVSSGPARRWKPVRKFFEMVQKFTDGLAVLKSTADVVRALALSILIWGMAGATNLLMMHSIDLSLPLYAPFFLVVMQSFGVMVPSPGFVGSYQFAHIVALSVYGVSKPVALSLAILIHAGYFVTMVGAGLFFLVREHLSWRELEEVSVESGP